MQLKKLLLGGVLLIFMSGCAGMVPPPERKTPQDGNSPLITQLRKNAKYARKDITVAIGDCQDKTGQFKDAEQLRYSRAVTQACRNIASHLIGKAGFTVVDREPYNLALISNEHQMSNTFDRSGVMRDQNGNPKNLGLIQENRARGGIIGASLVWSAAVTSYASSVTSGGGGVEMYGTGINYRESTARVAVISQVTDMRSVILDSASFATEVVGRKAGFNISRITSIFGGGTFFSAELGAAQQMPVDMAFEDALIANLVTILERNKSLFYKGNESKVSFDINNTASKPVLSQGLVKAPAL